MALQQPFGLAGAVLDRKGARDAERVEPVQVAAGRQHVRVAQEVAARRGACVAAVEGVEKRRRLAVGGEQRIEARALGRIADPRRVEHLGPRLRIHRHPDDVEAVRNKRVFEFQNLALQRQDGRCRLISPRRLGSGQFDGGGLRLDQLGQARHLLAVGLRSERAPTVERGLEVGQAAIKPRLGDRRREIADQRRSRAALGERALRRIVGRVEIDVRQSADQPVGPARAGKPGLLARHELQRPVRAEMENGVGAEVFADPAVKRGERVSRREAALEQQPHRIALVAEGGLDPDEDIAETRAVDEQPGAIALVPAGRGTPLRLDLAQPALAAHVVVGRDPRRDVGVGAVACRIAFEDRPAQRLDVGRNLDVVAGRLERQQRVVERGVDRQVGGGTGAAAVGRKVKKHDRELALRPLAPAQRHELGDARGEGRGPFGIGRHVARASPFGGGRAAAERHRPDRAVQLGNGDHHRGLDGREAAGVLAPLLQGLELDGMGGDVGHVELGQHVLGSLGVVVGRAADERKAGKGHHRVDDRPRALKEIGAHRRARIETAAEGWNDAQAAGLERRDHTVVVPGVAGEDVGAHDEHADRPGLAGARKVLPLFRDLLAGAGMIKADVGIAFGRQRGRVTAQGLTGSARIAVDQHADELLDVVVRPGEPVLQPQEIAAHVLRLARNEAQDLRQPLQHLHLAGAAGAPAGALAAQPLQPTDEAGGLLAHGEIAEARELDHLAGGHAAQHGVAMVPARDESGQHHPDVIVEEHHHGDDDVALGNVGAAGFQGGGVAAPFVGGVHAQLETRHVAAQGGARAVGRARDVAVERHDDDPDRHQVSRRSELLHHTKSRR